MILEEKSLKFLLQMTEALASLLSPEVTEVRQESKNETLKLQIAA